MLPYDEEYRRLIEDAHQAVWRLLDESRHDSWMSLRTAFGDLRRVIELDNEHTELSRKLAEEEQRKRSATTQEEESRSAMEAWGGLSRAAREALLWRVLGDEHLLIREITDRLNRHLGFPTAGERGFPAVYETNLRGFIKRLYRSGQLDRAPETFQVSKLRYRYARKRALSGPIIDLERAYGEGEAV